MFLHDSLSNRLKKIIKTKKVIKLFVCGPTVYDSMHIGHARTYIFFDTLVRFLRSQNYKIEYLQNITDIDDKIIERAQKLKINPLKFAVAQTKDYKTISKKLNIISVDKYVNASSVISIIINQIKRLIDKGYAYETKNGVYFRVRKFKFYGELSGQDLEALRSGYRIELDKAKEDVFDFALWKKTKDNQAISWPSPWGSGRPGWHIEDTAISEKYFGLQYDLHGGGVDLKFPHHEAEIAQAESLSGKKPFVKIWLHTGFLTFNNEKMSKSLKNFITVKDFLTKYNADVLRFIVLSSSYRSSLSWNESLINQSIASLLSIKSFLVYLKYKNDKGDINKKIISSINSFNKNFTSNLNDDMNTPKTIASIFEFINNIESIKNINKKSAKAIEEAIRNSLNILGIKMKINRVPKNIKDLIDKREVLRIVKDFNKADKIRKEIEALNFRLDDTDQGPILTHNNFING
ncbi:MAG: cysteine--tRNA ligase [Candidatus Liptonbacteria bacterium CG11_big_fil_rev_8_21_14_0_20_35_14]|uniref:Cysteine--tRNA ligase n=1 Tax=Candidatus Liptonbacteria bacterium CG11_big_fil_rev_8_21_14_0_20_35_14 TaxID=1974634 RepID=A0A2H0N7H8_9BACT|nr:MAG: cysteine--tRNA ligase [Candidatus Liptonbacteria bacterium CG11_big_fil_rev_8_21_14_0_20_35_14]